MMAAKQPSPKVLLFPILAHGHLSPFFQLAKTLSHDFAVYFCSTPVNLKMFGNKLDEYSIRQVEFHVPSSDELPPHYHTTNGLPPHLLHSLITTFENSAPSIFSDILKSVQPDLVIYDLLQPWLPPITTSYHIPSVFFQTCSDVDHSYKMRSVRPDLNFPSTAIFYRKYEVNSSRQPKSPTADDKDDKDEYVGDSLVNWIEKSHDIILIRSSKALTEKYIDFESSVLDKKVVCVGSLVSEPEDDDDDSKIIQWLNGKEKASTVYISFGSEVYLTTEELKEMALGLEISNVNFIWVLRSPYLEKTKLEEVMPNGFLDRTKGKGIIEFDLVPQTKILKHPSIGAFVSHCGWGSVLESISFGVPIIAMPMQVDQPLNARLVVELGVGLEVVGEENGMRKGEEIGRIIEEVMLKDEGVKLMNKSKELGMKMRVKSKEEVDVAIQELRRICEKKKNESPL